MASSRTILSRPRTRIYDSNYNIGESYYKGALDRLDRKYSGRPLSPPRNQASTAAEIAERHARAFAEEDIDDARRRSSQKIRENHLFDSRGARFSGTNGLFEENGISDETASSIQRIRATKKVAFIEDPDLESTSSHLKTQRMLDRSEKILDSIGINETSSSRRSMENDYSLQKRAMKVSYDADASNLTKWSALENGESANASSAVLRARQSRARIDDIDEEMAAMQEKQAARERRVARLKKLVAECDAESVDDNGVSTLAISETKERKSVRF